MSRAARPFLKASASRRNVTLHCTGQAVRTLSDNVPKLGLKGLVVVTCCLQAGWKYWPEDTLHQARSIPGATQAECSVLKQSSTSGSLNYASLTASYRLPSEVSIMGVSQPNLRTD